MADPVSWQGLAVEPLEGLDGATEFWRLPKGELASVSDPEVAFRARTAAGVHTRLTVRGTGLNVRLELEAGEDNLDFVVDGVLQRVPVRSGWQDARVDFPDAVHDVMLVLPGAFPSRVAHIEVEGEVLPRTNVVRPTWVAYGSSIMQGLGASGPTDAWPWLTAKALGSLGVNIGLGGQCHLDPFIADWLRGVQADLLTFCLGINIHGRSTFSVRTLHPAVVGFLRRVREGHPETPFVVVTPLYCEQRETTPNAMGLTLRQVRDIVAEAAAVAADLDGVPLRIVDGLTLVGEADAAVMPDGLHPDSGGHVLIADRLTPILREAMR